MSRKLTWVALSVLTFTALMVGRRRNMPKRSVGARGFVLAIALLGLAAGPAAAVGIVGSKLQAKPSIKFQFQSKDPAITPAGINPPVDGATLTVTVGATTLTFNMPGGMVCVGAPCWTGDAATGWKYKNSAAPGAPGVVKIAQIKAAKLKVLTKGSSGDVGGAFPLPVPAATDVGAVLTASGATYCATFPFANLTNNDAIKGYLNKNPSLVTGSCGGGGTTTTTIPASMCEAIVTGNPIAGTYQMSSIGSHCSNAATTACTKDGDCSGGGTCVGSIPAENVKLCTQNASDQTKVFKLCSADTDCGATSTPGTCARTPWVTLGALTQATPPGATTTFSVTAEGSFPTCEHPTCIPCGSGGPLPKCAGVQGGCDTCQACANSDCTASGAPCACCTGNGTGTCVKTCTPSGTNANCPVDDHCCPSPGFTLPSLYIPGVGVCTRLDQNACGSGVVNTSNPQSGHNVVKKSGDTSDPGPDCVYGAGDPVTTCSTADGDTAGLVFRTVGLTACKTGVPPAGLNCPTEADGIQIRLSTPGLSTSWFSTQASCGSTRRFNTGDTLATQLQLNAEPSTSGAVGEFADHNADSCAIGPGGTSQGFGTVSRTGPYKTVGTDATKPAPHGGTGFRTAAAGIAFSALPGEGDVGFMAITPNSGPTVVGTGTSCGSCPAGPPGCPEPAGP